ncbi:MAG: type II toxin-antitoxin system PemK/MazF family toxin [Myxococcaceae bacterium]
MSDFPKRGDIYWVDLDPTVGSEIQKTRPALVISNDAGNELSSRLIVAPITSSAAKNYPFQVVIELNGKPRKILLDQIRTIDKLRLKNKITTVSRSTMTLVEKAIKVSLALS